MIKKAIVSLYYLLTFLLLAIILINVFSPYFINFSTGSSMHPTYDSKQVNIIDETVTADELNEGDIILFRTSCDWIPPFNKKVVHRVQNTSDGVITTKGDNNNYVDQQLPCIDTINNSNLIGVVENTYSIPTLFS
jgi:signal peptidase I